MWIASLLLGLSAAGLGYVVLDMKSRPRTSDPRLGRFEVERRRRLREASRTYRWCEPWVDELARGVLRREKKLEEVQQQLVLAGNRAPWRPEEFLAVRRVEAVLVGALAAPLGWALGGWPQLLLFSVGGFFVYEFMARRLLKSEAIRRQLKLKRQFAAMVDLMALMMEVGSSFQDCLKVAANESRGGPLGDELALVRRDIAMGKRDDALRAFAERTADDDVSEVVMSVIEGEELGTPLAKIFRTQADQMRQKRSQWAEKAAAESEVALVFPAMLIMVACLITVAAPFILTAIFNPGA